jgi:hypothetical protein
MKLRLPVLSLFAVLIAVGSGHSQWVRISNIGGGTVNCFTARDTTIYVGTTGGLFISTNNGTSWATSSSNQAINSLLVSGNNIIVGSVARGMSLVSTDNATTWNLCNTGSVSICFISFLSNGGTLLGGSDGSGIFRSTDNGLSWKLTSPAWSYKVNSFAVVDANIFAGASGGIFRSTDNGYTWTMLNTGPYPINVTSLAAVGLHLYAGTTSGVLLSTNGGTSWSDLRNPATMEFVSCLAVSGYTLFEGTTGVYFLNDGESSWTSFNYGMVTYTAVKNLLVCGRYLYALTGDQGMYRRPLSEMVTSVEKLSADVPTHFSLDQNYPNPFNPSTMISFSVPSRQLVTLKVFDALGREVSILVSEELASGIYSRHWDAANVPSGVYFYRLQAGEFVGTKKMVLLR